MQSSHYSIVTTSEKHTSPLYFEAVMGSVVTVVLDQALDRHTFSVLLGRLLHRKSEVLEATNFGIS